MISFKNVFILYVTSVNSFRNGRSLVRTAVAEIRVANLSKNTVAN